MELIETYQRYRKWWLRYVAPDSYGVSYQGQTEEEAFRNHINNHNLYEFIELMETWSYE